MRGTHAAGSKDGGVEMLGRIVGQSVGLALGFCAVVLLAADGDADSAPKLVTAGNEPKQVFAYKLTPGLFAHFEVRHQMTVISEANGEVEKVTNHSNSRKHFRVVSVDEQGNAVLEPIVDSVYMSAKFGETDPIVYDSTKDVEPPRQFREVKATIGRPVSRVTVSPNGTLQKVTLLEGAPSHLAESSIKNDPRLNFLVVFPTEPIGVGATWRERFTAEVVVGQNLKQPVTLQRQYDVTAIDGTVATLKVRTSVITPLSNPQVEAQLMQRKPSGTIQFDLERGLILSQSTAASEQVVGAFGPKTSVQASSETQEKWVPNPAGVQPASLVTP